MAGNTNYPSALDNFPVNNTGLNPARLLGPDLDDVRAAINAIESELGINPKGSYTTVAARISASVFSVKDYGATGNGSTDDTAAVTAAISACSAAGGGTVMFPAGTYLVTTSTNGITVPDGVRIVGVGAKSIIKAANNPGAGKALFGVANAATVEFADLTIRGPTTWGAASDAVTAIYSSGAGFPTEIRCRGIHFIGNSYAIRLTGTTRLLVNDCDLDGQGLGATQNICTGIHIADNTGGSYVQVRGSQFRGFGSTDALSHAFYPYPSVSYDFSDCQFDQTLAGDIFTPHGGGVTTNVPFGIVSNCRFTHASTSYFGLRTQQYGRTKIIGCYIDVSNAIEMQGECIIANNDFVNVAGAGTNSCIAELTSASALKATIIGNRFNNNNGIDIFAQIAGGSTFLIEGNDFASGSNNGHVVTAAGTSPTIIAVGNNFRGQTTNCDALEMNGSGSLYANANNFNNNRDAIRINTGATVARIGAVGNHFNQGGASFNYVAAPTNHYADSNYGTKIETEQNTAVASATTITLPKTGEFFTVSGTTTITSVTASWAGRRVTLLFSGALTLTDGSNLKLAGNFVTTTDDTITLISDGTNWVEISRSVN